MRIEKGGGCNFLSLTIYRKPNISLLAKYNLREIMTEHVIFVVGFINAEDIWKIEERYS